MSAKLKVDISVKIRRDKTHVILFAKRVAWGRPDGWPDVRTREVLIPRFVFPGAYDAIGALIGFMLDWDMPAVEDFLSGMTVRAKSEGPVPAEGGSEGTTARVSGSVCPRDTRPRTPE